VEIGQLTGILELQDKFSGPLEDAANKITSSLTHAVSSMTEMADRFQNLSERTGIGVEALQKFDAVGATVGQNAEGIATAYRKLSSAMESGSLAITGAFTKLGLSADTLKTMLPEQQIETMIKALAGMEAGSERTALATQLLGRAGAALVPIGTDYDNLAAKAQRLGFIMSKESIKAADDLGDAYGFLEKALTGVTNNIGDTIARSGALLKAVDALSEVVASLSEFIHDNQAAITAWIDSGVSIAVDAIKLLGTAVKDITRFINSLSPTTKTIVADLTLFVAVIGSLALGALSTVGAIGALYKGFLIFQTNIVAAQAASFAFGNSIPVLTARLWLMENATLASAAALGIFILQVTAAVAAGAIIGVTIGTLIRDYTGLGEAVDKAAVALFALWNGENSDLEHGKQALEGATKAELALLDAHKKRIAEASVGSITFVNTQRTDEEIRGMIDKANAAQKLAAATAALGPGAAKVKELSEAMRILSASEHAQKIEGQTKALKELMLALNGPTQLEKTIEATRKLVDEMERVRKGAEKWKESSSDVGILHEKIVQLSIITKGLGPVASASVDEVGRAITQMKALGVEGVDAAKKLHDEWEKTHQGIQLIGTQIKNIKLLPTAGGQEMATYASVLSDVRGEIRETEQATDKLNIRQKVLDDLFFSGEISLAKYTEMMDKLKGKTDECTEAEKRFAEIMKQVAAIDSAHAKFDGVVGILKDLGLVNEEMDKIVQNAGTMFDEAAKAGEAFAKQDYFNTAIHGIKYLIAEVKTGAGLFKMIFGDSDKDKMAKMKDDFINAAGGIADLQVKAAKAHVSLDELFRSKTPEEMHSSIVKINDQLHIEDDLQRTVAEDIEASRLAQERFTEEMAKHNDAVDKTRAAMEKYGISVSEMGQKWAQQELDKKMGDLFQDYELLTAAGADQVLVIEKMGPALNEYVQESLKAKTSIPENMRPILEAMAKQGLLTDEAGNKLADLSGISFSESLTEQVRDIVSAVRDLVNALKSIPQFTDVHVRQFFDPAEGAPIVTGVTTTITGNGPINITQGNNPNTTNSPNTTVNNAGRSATPVQLVVNNRVFADAMVDNARAGRLRQGV
jgi:hypothetical protein